MSKNLEKSLNDKINDLENEISILSRAVAGMVDVNEKVKKLEILLRSTRRDYLQVNDKYQALKTRLDAIDGQKSD